MYRNDTTCISVPAWSCAAALLFFVSLNVTAAIHHDNSLIESGALNNITGAVGINMAAGDNNIQANVKSIAVGKSAQAITSNQMQTSAYHNQTLSSVSIEANTLHNAKGLISINQVAGSGNVQLNDIAIAFGENATVMSDALLMTSSPINNNPVDEPNLANNKVHLDKNSMSNASGIIQVNQIAGHGNTVMNRVSMPIQ